MTRTSLRWAFGGDNGAPIAITCFYTLPHTHLTMSSHSSYNGRTNHNHLYALHLYSHQACQTKWLPHGNQTEEQQLRAETELCLSAQPTTFSCRQTISQNKPTRYNFALSSSWNPSKLVCVKRTVNDCKRSCNKAWKYCHYWCTHVIAKYKNMYKYCFQCSLLWKYGWHTKQRHKLERKYFENRASRHYFEPLNT